MRIEQNKHINPTIDYDSNDWLSYAGYCLDDTILKFYNF